MLIDIPAGGVKTGDDTALDCRQVGLMALRITIGKLGAHNSNNIFVLSTTLAVRRSSNVGRAEWTN